jgi:hypothetical protein
MVTPWPNVTRTFQPEKRVLQREAVGGSQDLQRPAYAVLGVLALVWIASLAWGLRRLEGAVPPGARQHETGRVREHVGERQPVGAARP